MAKKLTTEDLVLNIIVNSNKAQSEIGKLGRIIQDNTSKLNAAEAEMKKLEKANQTSSTRYKSLQADVSKYNTVINDSKNRLGELNQTLSLQDKSLKQLEQSLRRTRQMWRQATNDTDRKRYADEMELLNRRISELKNGSEQTGNALLRMSSKIQQYFAVITAGIASFMAAFSGVSKAITEYARFDDVLADVMKTTNLSKAAAKELNEELKQIETRTSQEDRLGLARIAGKLGYSEIEEITEFVRANNQIIVALNEDLGGNVEETVNKIGKLVDVFKLKDLYDTEEAFLKVGSAINELGMASTANEGYMVEFARRMAGVAPLAGVTIEQILGLGAALDQLGQTEEVASTALSKLFLAIAKDAKTYSKYAGMEVKAFTELLEKDFMAAFTKVLQGVRNNSEGINALAATLGDLGQDGGRVIGIIGSLANNVDILTGSINLSNKAMSEGTSITDEYNIKNETAAAKLEMAKNQATNLWVELGEKLWPAMTEGLNLWTMLLSILSKSITFISNNIRVITSLTIAIIAYYTAVQIAAKWEAITTAYMIAKNIIVKGAVIAYGLLTGQLTRAAAAQQLLNLRMMANPYGLAAAALAGLITYLIMFKSRTDAATEAQLKLSDAIGKANIEAERENSVINWNLKILNDQKQSLEAKLTAIKRLREIMPDVLQDYKDEEILAGKANDAIKAHAEAIRLRARARAIENLIVAQEEERLALDNRIEAGYEYLGLMEKTGLAMRGLFSGQGGMSVYLKDIAQAQADNNAKQQTYNQYLEKTLALLDLAEAQSMLNINPESGTKVPTTDPKAEEKARKEAYKKELEEAEKHYQEQLQAEGLFRKDKREMTADELEKLAKIEAEYQEKVDSINKKYDKSLKDTTKIADAELTKRLASEQRYIDSLLAKKQTEVEAERNAFDERLKKAGLFGLNREGMTDRQLQALDLLEKQHKENILKINKESVKKVTDAIQDRYKTQLSDMRIAHNEELSSITTLSDAKNRLERYMSKRELRGINDLNEAKRILSNQHKLEEENATRQHLEELLRMMQEAVDSGDFSEFDILENLSSEESKEILLGHIREVKEALARLTGKEIDPKEKTDVFGMSSDDWETLFNNIKRGKFELEDLIGVLGAVTEMFSQYSNLVTQKENAMIQKDQDANERKKENLRKRLDAGTITQESYNQQVEKMDRDMDRKRAEISRKQAKRDKAVALMSAIVNTATGVTRVLASPGGIAGLILAGIIGAFGAVQIGTIASTPLPSIEGRESGGYLKVERSQDGQVFNAKVDPQKRGYVQEPTVIVGENGSEWVANAQAVKNPTVKPILDVLDTAQRNGTISTMNLQDIIAGTLGRRSVQGRQVGGYVNRDPDRDSVGMDPRMYEVLHRLDGTVDKLTVGLKNLKAEVAIIGKNGFLEKWDEYNNIEQDANL